MAFAFGVSSRGPPEHDFNVPQEATAREGAPYGRERDNASSVKNA